MSNIVNENCSHKISQVSIENTEFPVQENYATFKQKFRQKNQLRISFQKQKNKEKTLRVWEVGKQGGEQKRKRSSLMDNKGSQGGLGLVADQQRIEQEIFMNREIIEKYELVECLGNGANGKVYKVRNRTSQKYYVAKVVMFYDQENRKNVMNEFQILCQLDSQYIVKGEEMFESEQNNQIVIVMEFIEGWTLDEYMKNKDKRKDRTNIANQLLEALEYLHSQEVIHRDIQNANIMVDGDGMIKLIDFGVAKRIEYQQNSTNGNDYNSVIFTPTGIIEMRPPEIQEFHGYTFKSDIWQLGLVLLELFVFKKVTTQKLIKKVEQLMINQSYEDNLFQIIDKYDIHSNAKKLLISCLQNDPQRRPTIQQLQLIYNQI